MGEGQGRGPGRAIEGVAGSAGNSSRSPGRRFRADSASPVRERLALDLREIRDLARRGAERIEELEAVLA
jgi:hypothetical protein